MTTYELVAKDFALDPDENRLRQAAHLMVSSMAGSLALVTCKEPLRLSLSSQLRQMLQSQESQNVVEHIVQVRAAAGLLPGWGLGAQPPRLLPPPSTYTAPRHATPNPPPPPHPTTTTTTTSTQAVVTDNLELACTIIEKTALDKAQRDIDKSLAAAYEARKRAKALGQSFYELAAYQQQQSKFPASLPDSLKYKPGVAAQQRVYDDFARILRELRSASARPPGQVRRGAARGPVQMHRALLRRCCAAAAPLLRRQSCQVGWHPLTRRPAPDRPAPPQEGVPGQPGMDKGEGSALGPGGAQRMPQLLPNAELVEKYLLWQNMYDAAVSEDPAKAMMDGARAGAAAAAGCWGCAAAAGAALRLRGGAAAAGLRCFGITGARALGPPACLAASGAERCPALAAPADARPASACPPRPRRRPRRAAGRGAAGLGVQVQQPRGDGPVLRQAPVQAHV
jgi:CCR4-NOT transcription complex subunit 1